MKLSALSVCVLFVNAALIFGAAYVIIWEDQSFWWMILAVVLQSYLKPEIKEAKGDE
jgi:hypothetical protein